MITVKKIFTFDAAHYLPDYPGKCAHMHGHTYKLEVELTADMGRTYPGIIVDFRDTKEIVEKAVINRFDHRCLNVVWSWEDGVPSAENMVLLFSFLIQKELKERGENIVLNSLVLWETPTCCAIWRNEKL